MWRPALPSVCFWTPWYYLLMLELFFSLEKEHASVLQATIVFKLLNCVREPILLEPIPCPYDVEHRWAMKIYNFVHIVHLVLKRDLHILNQHLLLINVHWLFRFLMFVLNCISKARLSWNIHLIKISLALNYGKGGKDCHWEV